MHGPWFLYLDESGDLGFCEDKEGRSRYFTICILAIRGVENNRSMAKAVRKTLNRKLNPKGKRSRFVEELKGSATSIEVKKYFYSLVANLHFGIYALTLNKNRVYPQLQENKDKCYNYLSRLILDQLPFENADESVNLIIDKSKRWDRIHDFNQYIQRGIVNRLRPHVSIRIMHEDSKANGCLQATDVFCYGIARKYERNNANWFDVFSSKVRYDDVFLPPPKKKSVPRKP